MYNNSIKNKNKRQGEKNMGLENYYSDVARIAKEKKRLTELEKGCYYYCIKKDKSKDDFNERCNDIKIKDNIVYFSHRTDTGSLHSETLIKIIPMENIEEIIYYDYNIAIERMEEVHEKEAKIFNKHLEEEEEVNKELTEKSIKGIDIKNIFKNWKK